LRGQLIPELAVNAQGVGSFDRVIEDIPDAKITELTIDLLTKMLAIDPLKRITLSEAMQHPLNSFRSGATGSDYKTSATADIKSNSGSVTAIASPIKIDCVGSIHRLYYGISAYARSINLSYGLKMPRIFPVGILFLATDLIYRSIAMIIPCTVNDIIIHNTTCHFMARKYYDLYENFFVELSNFTYNMDSKTSKVFEQGMLDMEVKIINYLRGQIFRPYVYDACTTVDDVVYAIQHILPKPDVYSTFNASMLKHSGKAKDGTTLTDIEQYLTLL
jgi:hypothetical protein